ncbi:MAG: hypothetical protein NC489_09045 [Ruminococcus flavefaciens]|nr:hypothetical protein [Ruminococcus flavefaciens]
MTYEFLKSLYSDLLSIIQGSVVKRLDLAREGETLESARDFDVYLACVNGTRYFYTFPEFDEDILANYLDPVRVAEARRDRKTIPEELRDAIVRDQSQRVIDTYVEKNWYYRTLMGLPPLNDRHWIYVKGEKNIPEDVPIHKMTIDQISRLEIYGALDRIKRENPNTPYLDYLGINAIDLVQARTARNFDILRLGPSSNPRTIDMFMKEYHYARKFILATCYNLSEFSEKSLYDPIVGILMLSLAARNTMVPDEAAYLNFEEILDAILESYDFLRYFKRFPYTYKKRLVMKLDKLLQVKGTDGVLVDVCKIFSKEDLIANRYYLMKTYRMDANGMPLETDNPDEKYVLNFVKASIDEHDINTQEEYRESYENIVNNDYLWQLTDEERQKIESEDFNLMMSKYIDVQSAFDITSLVFETCCFINLLLYARDHLAKVSIDNVYATGGRCTLFTMLNFLLAAMAKRAHFDGNIVYDPMSIAEIWRFNYDDIEGQIRDIVDKYELAIDVDSVVLQGFEMELDKPAGAMIAPQILRTYVNNRELFDAICEEMNKTNDIRQYIALHDCRDVFFTSATEMNTFTKMDGSTAQTYAEMLEDLEPRLAFKLDSIDDEDTLNSLIVYILEQLEALFNTDELYYLWLNSPTIYGSIIGKYIRIAIEVFKASSVQLRSINIIFKLGDRDPIHVIDELHSKRSKGIDEVIHVVDTLAKHKVHFIDEYIGVGDKVYTNRDFVHHTNKEDKP